MRGHPLVGPDLKQERKNDNGCRDQEHLPVMPAGNLACAATGLT
jgi:hypothetical protein